MASSVGTRQRVIAAHEEQAVSASCQSSGLLNVFALRAELEESGGVVWDVLGTFQTDLWEPWVLKDPWAQGAIEFKLPMFESISGRNHSLFF